MDICIATIGKRGGTDNDPKWVTKAKPGEHVAAMVSWDGDERNMVYVEAYEDRLVVRDSRTWTELYVLKLADIPNLRVAGQVLADAQAVVDPDDWSADHDNDHHDGLFLTDCKRCQAESGGDRRRGQELTTAP